MSMTLKRLTGGRRVCKGFLIGRILIFIYVSSYWMAFFLFLIVLRRSRFLSFPLPSPPFPFSPLFSSFACFVLARH